MLSGLCAAVLLGAALTPCPESSAETHERVAAARSDAEACHGAAPAQQLSAPCPCGCGEAPGPSAPGVRLGLALPSQGPAPRAPEALATAAPAAARLPDAPPLAIERVPWGVRAAVAPD